jgi:hypothetical protein
MPGWSYTGRKEATRDDLVSVPGYNLFNLGARYTPGGEQGRVTCGLYADNITDKRYWKRHRRQLRRYFHPPGRANDGAALGALHFLALFMGCCFEWRMIAMSTTVKAHGMDGTLVEPDWPPLTLAEVRALLSQFPACGEPIEILS